jgi:hypothetical protein
MYKGKWSQSKQGCDISPPKSFVFMENCSEDDGWKPEGEPANQDAIPTALHS